MRREKVDPPKRFNKIIFFFIEVAYWAEYYVAKKTGDKMDSISTGFSFIYILLLIYIIMILGCINSVLFTILPPSPQETALGFFLFVISLVVILIIVAPYYIPFIIYKRVSKKELIRYFDEMTPERRRIGKIKSKVFLFASYSGIPLTAFFFLLYY